MKIIVMIIIATILQAASVDTKKIAYLVSDMDISFWSVMSRGIKDRADALGYEVVVFDSSNSAKRELELTIKIIKEKFSALIISPSNSSACVTILKLAKNANIPVVISDIGTDSGEYISYISSNNKSGAYNIGKILSKKLISKGWENGKVGIIAIPQKRLNGQERTAGFMKAMNEAGIKGADIKQLETWDNNETYNFTKEMINNYPDLRAVWLQTANTYNGAIRAISEKGKKNDIFLIAFDAEPEFISLISKGIIIASGMQQPYLMGEESMNCMHNYLTGKTVNKNKQIPILSISTENIANNIQIIRRNVLGL